MALLAGVIISAQLAGVFLLSPENRDFGLSFHASGRGWIETGQPYGLEALPNLNPPIVTMTLFVPAAYLSLRAAAVLWTALGAISLALTWCWLVHRLSMGGPSAVGSVGLLLCTMGAAGIVWLEGQITWLLLPVAAHCWWAYRSGSNGLAGFWLGVLITAKPFLALAALPLGALSFVSAGVVSFGLSLGSIIVTGWAPWKDWLSASRAVSWLASPGNASIWGLVVRWSGVGLRDPVTAGDVATPALGAIAFVFLSMAVWTATRSDRDERWTLAVLTAILCSPLGWTHYLPLVAPPLVALWVRERWTGLHTAAVALLCVPPGIGYSATAAGSSLGAVTLGSLYGTALLTLWAGVAVRKRCPAAENASHAESSAEEPCARP